MKKKIGIVGMGFVGTKMKEILLPFCEIITYDKKQGDCLPEELRSCDFVMVCVDTPSMPDGSVNICNVEDAIASVPCNKILLRSTVPPGTTAYLVKKYKKIICFSPEYIGESLFVSADWESFYKSKSFMIIGGEPKHIKCFIDDLESIFGPNIHISQMSSAEAELVKYMDNSYFAMKISFVNEFRLLSDKLNLNWHVIREGWLLDPRIERDHTSAFKENPGFGGKCLPKDIRGIIAFAEQNNVSMDLLKAIRDFNASITEVSCE